MYYVASPEACAAILWKSRDKAATVSGSFYPPPHHDWQLVAHKVWLATHHSTHIQGRPSPEELPMI